MCQNDNYLIMMSQYRVHFQTIKVRSIDKFTTETDFDSQLTGMLLQFALYPSLP